MSYPLCVAVGLLTLFMWVGQAAANTVTVTLEATSGNLKVSGRLISAAPDAYVLDTPAGQVTLKPDVVSCSGRACPVRQADPQQHVPEQMRRIELSSLDRKIDVKGMLRGVSDGRFVVEVHGIGLVSLQRKGLRCSGPGCRATVEMIARPSMPIQIVGSGYLVNDVLPPMLSGFAANTGAEPQFQRFSSNTYAMQLGKDGDTVFVGGTGTAAAFSALGSGAADLIVTGRQPTDAEVAALVAQGLTDPRGSTSETVIANTRLSVVTHPEIGIREMRLDQLARVFLGEIANWSELGGPDAPIIRVIRDPATDESAVFSHAVFGGPPPAFLRGALIASSQDEMIEVIAANRYSIGYVWDGASDRVASVSLIGSCGLASHDTPFAHDAGDALLGARIYLYAQGKTDAHLANDLAEFLAQNSRVIDPGIAASDGPAPMLKPQSQARIVAKDLTGPRAEIAGQLSEVLPRWDRLSTTFRPTDTEGLDHTSRHDLTKLVTLLADIPDEVSVAVVGFVPETGDFETGLQKSLASATRITEALKLAGGDALTQRRILPVGYGDLAPIACSSDPIGRQLNQRVEVWLRNAQP